VPGSLPQLTSPRYVDVRGWILLAAGILLISCTQSAASAGIVRGGASSALVQQFGGLNDQPPLGLLVSVQISDSSEINRLADELNALPAFPSGLMNCPMDDGSYFAIAFSYPDGASAKVKVEARGCQGVYVGGSTQPAAWAAKSPQLFVTLTRLIAHQPAS
jgi:hypothetical protein